MRCSFCGCVGHTRTDCRNPTVVRIQTEYIYSINHMISSAHGRMIPSVTLKRELEDWLSSLTVNQLRYILEYLNKKTNVRFGSTTLKINIIRNISGAVFHICNIDIRRSIVPMPVGLVPPLNTPPTTIPASTPPPVSRVAPSSANPETPTLLAQTMGRENDDDDLFPWVDNRTPVRAVTPREVTPPHAGDTLLWEVRRNWASAGANTTAGRTGQPRNVFQSPRPTTNIPTPNFRVNVVNVRYSVFKFDECCQEDEECPICYDKLTNDTFVKLNCSHKYCKKCIKTCISKGLTTCSYCREPVTQIYTQTPVVTYSL